MKTIIFDFDGTIADSLEVIIALYRELTGDDREPTKEEVDELRKLPIAKLVKELGIPLWRVPGMVSKGRKLMHEHLKDLKTFEGLPEILSQLHAQGYTLHIVSTNSRGNVEAFLDKHGMREYFDEIHGSVGLFAKAKTLRIIVKRFSLKSHETWYVGDEARDVMASHKAGLRVASVTWGYQHRELLEKMHPDGLADTPEQLFNLVTK